MCATSDSFTDKLRRPPGKHQNNDDVTKKTESSCTHSWVKLLRPASLRCVSRKKILDETR